MYKSLVVGVIRFSNTSNSSSVTFPESETELENTSYSAVPAKISIPSTLLLDRKAVGGDFAYTVAISLYKQLGLYFECCS